MLVDGQIDALLRERQPSVRVVDAQLAALVLALTIDGRSVTWTLGTWLPECHLLSEIEQVLGLLLLLLRASNEATECERELLFFNQAQSNPHIYIQSRYRMVIQHHQCLYLLINERYLYMIQPAGVDVQDRERRRSTLPASKSRRFVHGVGLRSCSMRFSEP